MEEGTQNPLTQIGSCGVLWIPSIANVLPLLRGNNQGGYGVVCKVWIEIFNCIPSTIELVGKTPKMDDKWEVNKQWSMEVLASPCKQPSVIKFLAIHVKTMEAYTLWWNGGTLWEMLDYNTKYCHGYIIVGRGAYMERPTWLVAFRQNWVKLAWAFINIMNAVHHYEILHNDLSKDNIMLHFSLDKPNVVYIGMCN
jgi:hypothetical protein